MSESNSDPPKNENARGVNPSARKVESCQSKPRSQTGFNNKDYEDRRNAAACFKNQNKTEDWHPDFVGVMVTENLPAGTKCWVSVKKRLTRKGDVYVTVTLKPKEDRRDVSNR